MSQSGIAANHYDAAGAMTIAVGNTTAGVPLKNASNWSIARNIEKSRR